MTPLSVFRTTRTLIRISRPRFWLYTAGSLLLGYVAGLPAGFREWYPPSFWVLFGYYLIPANLLIYGINDLNDADTDALNNKKDGYEHRLAATERQQTQLAVGISAAIGIALLGVIPVPWWPLHVGCLALAVIYSQRPIRLKARPLLDAYANILYALPAILGYALAAGSLPPPLTWILGLGWTAGLHTFSAIPDIEADRAAGVRTTAVWLGERRALWWVAAHWSLFAVCAVWLFGAVGLVTWLYPLTISLIIGISDSAMMLRRVNRVYRALPWINALVGFAAFVWKTLFS